MRFSPSEWESVSSADEGEYARKQDNMGHEKMKMYQRLWTTYRTLDAAIRNAESRVPRDWLTRRLLPAHVRHTLQPDDPCSICLCSLVEQAEGAAMATETETEAAIEGEEGVLELECGHRFHVKCGLQWFHRYATGCPNCRTAVSAPLGA